MSQSEDSLTKKHSRKFCLNKILHSFEEGKHFFESLQNRQSIKGYFSSINNFAHSHGKLWVNFVLEIHSGLNNVFAIKQLSCSFLLRS